MNTANALYGILLKPISLTQSYNMEVCVIPYYETDNLKKEVNKKWISKKLKKK